MNKKPLDSELFNDITPSGTPNRRIGEDSVALDYYRQISQKKASSFSGKIENKEFQKEVRNWVWENDNAMWENASEIMYNVVKEHENIGSFPTNDFSYYRGTMYLKDKDGNISHRQTFNLRLDFWKKLEEKSPTSILRLDEDEYDQFVSSATPLKKNLKLILLLFVELILLDLLFGMTISYESLTESFGAAADWFEGLKWIRPLDLMLQLPVVAMIFLAGIHVYTQYELAMTYGNSLILSLFVPGVPVLVNIIFIFIMQTDPASEWMLARPLSVMAFVIAALGTVIEVIVVVITVLGHLGVTSGKKKEIKNEYLKKFSEKSLELYKYIRFLQLWHENEFPGQRSRKLQQTVRLYTKLDRMAVKAMKKQSF